MRSRELKQEVEDLDTQAALQTLESLKAMTYAYQADPSEQHIGLRAADVADLIATNDRKELFVMGVVAVLTKVVQA